MGATCTRTHAGTACLDPDETCSTASPRAGQHRLSQLGVRVPAPDPSGDVALRYCVDWTEQAHHLSGAVGRTLTDRLFELGWLERIARTRGVRLTENGERGLREHLGLLPPGS